MNLADLFGKILASRKWLAVFFSYSVLVLACQNFFLQPLAAQTPGPQVFGQTIIWEKLSPHVTVLTSDSLEGREAGTIGEIRSANYLERCFQDIGLRPLVPSENGDSSFRQVMQLETRRIESGWIKGKSGKWNHLQEVLIWGGSTKRPNTPQKVLYAGSGSMEELSSLDLEDHIALIKCPLQDLPKRILLARELGAAGCLVVTAESEKAFEGQVRLFRLRSRNPATRISSTQTSLLGFPVVAVSPSVAAKVLNLSESKWRKQKLSLGQTGQELLIHIQQKRVKIPSYNLLGYVPGKTHPEEAIILSAHYDHLGMRRGQIHPGADDNAAGVAALLEIARAFSEAVKQGIQPERSIVFFACTAEEKGLLGSKYYSRHPLFPLDQTIANLNMDMIGHLDAAHQDNPRFVSVVGSDWLSSELHRIHENANAKYVQLELDYTYNSQDHPERFYYRSDQYNFAKHGIPVIFYTSGDHEDYHRPTDRLERLSPQRLEGVAQLIFYTAWELSFREKAIQVDDKP